METRQKKAKVVVSVLALASLVLFSLGGYAGKLEPSVPPVPTMKTLDEVEPRMAVQSLSGDANSQYIISQPSSYYLAGNITGEPNKCGIMIAANNVTVDLMGFGLIGVPGSQDCICVQYRETDESLPIEEVSFSFCIHNGTICNWGGNSIDSYNMFLKIEGGVVEGKVLVHSNSELLNVSVHSNVESGFCGLLSTTALLNEEKLWLFGGLQKSDCEDNTPIYTQSFTHTLLSLTTQPLIPDCDDNIRFGLFGLNITGYCVCAFYPDTRIFL